MEGDGEQGETEWGREGDLSVKRLVTLACVLLLAACQQPAEGGSPSAVPNKDEPIATAGGGPQIDLLVMFLLL